MRTKIPAEVFDIYEELSRAGFEAYLVGGSVRDSLLSREPKDWDITTNARPPQIQVIFKDSVYENQFGTVGVKTESKNERLKIVEITTFRLEGKYSDKRHPDEIKFADTVEEDLARRDFTVNAIALGLTPDEKPTTDNGFVFCETELIDPFSGEKDLEARIIRTVGNPDERFSEDALRLTRAVRLAIELDFKIETRTREAIKKNAGLIRAIARERIRDEFIKILMAPEAQKGMELLEEFGLLQYIAPELREGIGISQNKHHKYTVWEHGLYSLGFAASENYSLAVRLAALFHDIAKPRTKTGEGPDSHFYGHDGLSAKITKALLERLCFPREEIEKVVTLVRLHMFKADPEEITESAVRRTIRSAGPENIWELINLRTADRIGSGVPKAWPYRLRSYMALVEKNLREPVSLKQMVLKGDRLMELLGLSPGPRVGWILYILFEEILDEPAKNNLPYLEEKARDLNLLNEEELKSLAEKSKAAYQQILSEEEEEIRKKYYVGQGNGEQSATSNKK